MEQNYYAVERSGDSLAHYGVKGMKWGVRRAIRRGNDRALSRHYARAAKKLQKLSVRSDKQVIDKAKKVTKKRMLPDAAIGGLASGIGTYAINPHLSPKTRARFAATVGAGMVAANLIGDGINYATLSRWGSKKGNAKKVAKRKNFEREMRNSFKGTKYANKINKTKSDINKHVQDTRRILDTQLGTYSKASSKTRKSKKRR